MTTGAKIRAFVAVELSDGVRREVADVIHGLESARIRGLRTVSPEGLHLTLKFLGDVPESELPSIHSTISLAAGPHGPLLVEVGGFGAYPNESSPRVLWLGVEISEALLSLRTDLEDRLASLGFERDRREWSPHLTLGRARDRASKSDLRRAIRTLTAMPPVSESMEVSSVSLVRSTLLPGGAAYRTLSSVTLRSER